MATLDDLGSVERRHKINSLDKWKVFCRMDEEFVHNIHLFVIYGETGNEVIVVTKDDVVFHMNVNNITQMTELSELKAKGVIKIAVGKSHVCALTSGGDVYAWGDNNWSQLGTGTTSPSKKPLKITFNGQNIIDIDCGDCLTLALTRTGQVYAWGYNKHGELGTGNSKSMSRPSRVLGFFHWCHVTSIACGIYHSVAIDKDGKVYSWGYNLNGQLGLGHINNKQLPEQIPYFNDIKVSKVVAGYYHTIILSNDGSVYTFGYNRGQLGTGNTTEQRSPYKLDSAQHNGPFVDIATDKVNYISAAITITGKILAWGDFRHPLGTLLTPTVVNAYSMNDVFGLYGKIRVNYHSITIGGQVKDPMVNSLSKAFDDPITSSFQFVIDGRPIHVHREYLVIRCEPLRPLLDTESSVLEITQYSYEAFKAFLQYLYFNDVFVAPDIEIQIWVELLGLADTYAETELKRKCTRLICKSITVKNVALIYGAAVKHRVPALQDICFKYSVTRFTEVSKTSAFNDLDIEIYKDFIRKASLKGALH